MKVMALPVETVRDELFNSNFEWLRAKAHKLIVEGDYLAADTCLVVIDVDDPEFRFIVDGLMPNNEAEWQSYRDRGAKPIARGAVTWDIAELAAKMAPDLRESVVNGPSSGFIFAFVMSGGGITVYQVPYATEDMT